MALTAELEATRTRLQEQAKVVDALAREKADAVSRVAALEAELSDARSRTTTAESKLKRLTSAVDASKALQAQVASLQEQLDVMTSERNSASKKAESLRRDVARMTASSEELKSLDIPELVRAKKALEEKVVRMTSEALTLNEQLEQLQLQKQMPPSPSRTAASAVGEHGSISGSFSSAMSPSGRASSHVGVVHGSSVGGPGDASESNKVRELQRLANNLLEQLSDSADALQQQRATKEALGRRIHELEALLTEARLGRQ
jgi:chromosome segregation ATPase